MLGCSLSPILVIGYNVNFSNFLYTFYTIFIPRIYIKYIFSYFGYVYLLHTTGIQKTKILKKLLAYLFILVSYLMYIVFSKNDNFLILKVKVGNFAIKTQFRQFYKKNFFYLISHNKFPKRKKNPKFRNFTYFAN